MIQLVGAGKEDEVGGRRFGAVLREYERITGHHETNPESIFHHQSSMYGPPCPSCGKPLRSPPEDRCDACSALLPKEKRVSACTPETVEEIRTAFAPVIGLQLSIARDAGSMKVFHFGEVRPHPNGGTIGQYALHIQCPWRIVASDLIVTGSEDYHEPADCMESPIDWNEKGRPTPSLQEKRLLDLFLGYDTETRSCENITDKLVVEGVEADIYGGVQVNLSGGYSLQLFPERTSEWFLAEHWRLFEPAIAGSSFVMKPRTVSD